MSENIIGFGGDEPQQHNPIESPDSIQSKQYARILDLISEGEIEGLVNGGRSIYLDDTPLQNADGSFNFSVMATSRVGTQDQSYIEGAPGVEAEIPVGVQVKYGIPVTRQITNTNINSVRLTISIPALFQQQTNGDTTGATVQYKIERQSNGGGFVPVNLAREWKTSGISIVSLTATASTNASGIGFTLVWTPPTPTEGQVDVINYTVQYKLVSSGTWLTYKTDSLSNSGGFGLGIFIGTNKPTKTYNINGLTEGIYQIRAVVTSGPGSLAVTNAFIFTETSTVTVSDKTTTKYQRNHVIPLVGSAPWDIRVTRLTGDSTTQTLQNNTWWDSYTEVIDVKLRYPNSALVGIQLDASQFRTIPRRAYHVKLLKVKVPTNYDPNTRVYTGLWDGTFKIAWTDNPAWCFYDIIIESRYGLGSYIDTALVDKFTLYNIGQYCDALVPDGFGGFEPRFTCNLYLQTREEAYRVVANMASIFRGMIYWGVGTITAIQDKPEDVSFQFTNADVIDGLFSYSGSAKTSRHTVARVSWNDPLDRYKQKIEYVEDTAAIAKFGVVESDMVAFGCTSRGQARRLGKWLLYTEANETEVATFKVGLKGAYVTPGKIIRTFDNNRAGVRFGGRLISSTSSSVTLDSSVTLSTGETYTISLVLPDGTIVDKIISNAPGTYTVLNLTTTLSTLPLNYSMWILRSATLSPELWRVLSVSEDGNLYNIVAVTYNPNKYAFVEQDIAFENTATSIIPTSQAHVTNITIIDSLYYLTQDVIGVKLLISWEAPLGAVRYTVTHTRAGSPPLTINTTTPSIELLNVEEGDCVVTVVAFGALGKASTPVIINKTVLGRMNPPSNVAGFKIDVLGSNAYLSWDAVPDLDLSHYIIKFSSLITGASWSNSSVLVEKVAKPATSITVPLIAGTYLIKAVDYYTNESVVETLIISSILTLEGFNSVVTVTENPTFSGTKTNCTVSGSELRLSSGQASGLYEFAGSVDLGAKYISRLTANLDIYGIGPYSVMSGWSSLAILESMAGTIVTDWEIDLQLRQTNDNPAGTPTWSAWKSFVIGDYEARAYQFRIYLYSLAANVTPSIKTLQIKVDMPDRIHAQNDLVCTTAGLTPTFTKAFKQIPAIAISAQGMQTGDYYEITNKGVSAFTIIFRNSASTAIQRTFDYVAKGYGSTNIVT